MMSKIIVRTLYFLIISNILIVFLYYFLTIYKLSICWTCTSQSSFVITLSGNDHRVPLVIDLFRKYANLNLQPYYGINGNIVYEWDREDHITSGERGLRDTMTNLFTMIIYNNYNKVFIFEDDAIPHRNFTILFQNLSTRCREADVLLLGATIIHPSRDQWSFDICFDANKETYGAFALFIKKNAFIPILEWLRQRELLPFDAVYTHLQKLGYIVRVAYPPFLVIADVSHPSLTNKNRKIDQKNVKERALIHHWNLEDYPMFVLPV